MITDTKLKEAFTVDLLNEIESRSLSCLIVAMRVEESGIDEWRYRVKGSGILLGAMTAALQMEINRVIEKRDEGGEDPVNDGVPR